MEAQQVTGQASAKAVQVAQGQSSISQPCLANLVVYTEEKGDEALVTDTIAEYVVKQPCRVILAVAQPRGG